MNAQVDALLRLLRGYPLVQSVRIVNYDETPQGKLEIKIRCHLAQNYQLQVWLHLEPQSFDYAYQLFSTQPILRWDNAPHYPQLVTAPHHFHDDMRNVVASPLTGDLLADASAVLVQIANWLESRRTKRD